MVKVALIGVGSMGKNHARVYGELPDAELVEDGLMALYLAFEWLQSGKHNQVRDVGYEGSSLLGS
jgi:predicted dehydrogenase